MKTLTIGPFIFTVEYKSRNFRKQVEAELARGLVFAVKKARELRPGMSLKDAYEYAKAISEERKEA